MGEVITKTVPLTYTVPKTTRVKIAELCPLNGKIVSVTVNWHAGCKGYVHVAFGHGDTWVYPSEVNTFIALEDATPVVPCNEPVVKNEMLWADIRNGDILNPHTITVIPTIVGVED